MRLLFCGEGDQKIEYALWCGKPDIEFKHTISLLRMSQILCKLYHYSFEAHIGMRLKLRFFSLGTRQFQFAAHMSEFRLRSADYTQKRPTPRKDQALR